MTNIILNQKLNTEWFHTVNAHNKEILTVYNVQNQFLLSCTDVCLYIKPSSAKSSSRLYTCSLYKLVQLISDVNIKIVWLICLFFVIELVSYCFLHFKSKMCSLIQNNILFVLDKTMVDNEEKAVQLLQEANKKLGPWVLGGVFT